MPNKINMPFKTDIKKHWDWLDKKALELFIDYLLGISQGTLIDSVVYYRKKLTKMQQGKITGYADCLRHIDYMINEDIAE